jgi:two-component system sensor histidine kinase YesM
LKLATARFRRPANGGVRLGRARSAARMLMSCFAAALVLLTLAVFYYTRNTAQAMEASCVKKCWYPPGRPATTSITVLNRSKRAHRH